MAASRANNAAKATAQLSRLVSQVSTIVDNACKKLAEAIAKNCAPAHDIAGIRQLALDNAQALWPMLHPSSRKQQTAMPVFRIIVFGIVPKVRAEIIYSDANCENVIFFRAPTDVSAEAAVEGLLETTMLALDMQDHAHVFRNPGEQWVSACLPHATGSGWYCE